MKRFDQIVKISSVLEGITRDEDIASLMQCVDGEVSHYRAGDAIIGVGEDLYFLGNLLAGIAQEQEADGSASRTFSEGELITEGFSEEKSVKAGRGVVAKTDCTVLWMRWIRVSKICNFSCEFHKKALQNLDHLME